jgi:exodeoxyribonuclease V alpha subunit
VDEGKTYIQIEGAVESLIYRNSENGYCVLRLESPEGTVTAVGTLPDVFPGELLTLTGEWSSHPSYGEQFKTEFFTRSSPAGADSILRYLSSGAVRGVGEKRAKEIVAAFGADTLTILETQPERLAEIRGITLTGAREIGEEFRRTSGVRRLIEHLTRFSVKPAVAMRLYRDMGDEALDTVLENPYVMTDRRYGAAFFEADAMALGLGFDEDSPQRVEAAIIFEMRHNLQNGHTFLPFGKLSGATAQLIEADADAIAEALDSLCDAEEIVREQVAGQDACYLKTMYDDERYLADKLKRLADSTDGASTERIDALISDVERTQGVTYAAEQRKAVHLAASSRVLVLTGGPGTGKTTSVKGIIALFDALGLRSVLCAPTGRAAKRLGQLVNRDDSATVHRVLGAGMGGDGELIFERCEDDPLKADAVIVDESSMLDLQLARALVEAIPEDCRLVLVGDSDQLPSVGPGNVFSDIIRSGAVPVVTLTEIFRQAKESGIVSAAHMVNHGETPDISVNRGDFFFLKRLTVEKIAETITELCTTRLPENMGIEHSQIQVLSPTRRGEAGTKSLNTRLQASLNPKDVKKREREYGGFTFREGDRVMQIRNDYDIMWKSGDGSSSGYGVYNGDLGFITAIDFSYETLTVDYDDKIVEYLFEQLSDLEPAFAMTVHKSQGSEYNAVVLAIPPGAPRLSTRSVLYTALTRAKELLILVGDPAVFDTMVRNDKRQRRYSGLRARLDSGDAT